MYKRFALFCLFFAVILLVSCSDNDQIQNPSGEKGSTTLKIDRLNAPENVTNVIAYLSRANYETLTGSMNLISDTTAEISFTELEPGIWHLLVEAEDEEGTVTYSGESDVEVISGQVTQVNLTLLPTGQGLGTISIHVGWGNNNTSSWIDYYNNPIFTRYQSPTNPPYGVRYCKILFDEDIYKMWYLNVYPNASASVWYATSNDGINFNSAHNQPVLAAGNYWDYGSVVVGAVLKTNNSYKMYYTGTTGSYQGWQIGLATSTDGINWTKYPTPILSPSSEEGLIQVADVTYLEGIYYLYYNIYTQPYPKIALATSVDGVTFTKSSDNPVLTGTYPWENGGIESATVLYEDDKFKMIYQNASETAFGYAESSNGVNWTKNSEPVFTDNDTHNQWAYNISYPYWRKFNNQYRIYYTGTAYSGEVSIALSIKN